MHLLLIGRRVYDALNVLEAVGIIDKDRKAVRWIGFPEEVSGLHFMHSQREERRRQVELKGQKLKALIGQLVAYKRLISRNKNAAAASELNDSDNLTSGSMPTPEAGQAASHPSTATGVATIDNPRLPCEPTASAAPHRSPSTRSKRIEMPFLLVTTGCPSHIDCAIADDRQRALLKFEQLFQIHDDADVMRRLNLHVPDATTKLDALLPPDLMRFANEGTIPVLASSSASFAKAATPVVSGLRAAPATGGSSSSEALVHASRANSTHASPTAESALVDTLQP